MYAILIFSDYCNLSQVSSIEMAFTFGVLIRLKEYTQVIKVLPPTISLKDIGLPRTDCNNSQKLILD